MSKTLDQVKAELNAKIPRDVISSRSAGQGRSLSYLEGHYVIDRLNQIFGPDNWSKTVKITKLFDGEVNDKNYVSYMAEVTLYVTFPGQEISKYSQDVGFGDGTDSNNPGKTHELAIKEAVTDGLKRCAKDLGMSMGLALYDKTQENVEEEAKPTPKPAAAKAPTVAPTPLAAAPAVGSNLPRPTKAIIKETFNTLKALGKITAADFVEKHVKPFGAAKVDDLDDINASKALNKIKSTYPELRMT